MQESRQTSLSRSHASTGHPRPQQSPWLLAVPGLISILSEQSAFEISAVIALCKETKGIRAALGVAHSHCNCESESTRGSLALHVQACMR